MPDFAPLPDPPYYAVIFTALRRDDGDPGYSAMADKMFDLAKQQPGYIGVESTCSKDGLGITVSYWTDEAALTNWKAVSEHRLAQQLGRKRWYSHCTLRIAKVERHYNGPEGR